jgi:hypothetical protein
MYRSVFREWKVAAVFVGGICLFVGAYFAEGGGYEQLEFGRKEAPKAASVAVTALAARPAPPAATRFTSDEELAAAFADPSEAAPTPSASVEAGAAPVDGAPQPVGEGVPAPAPVPSGPVEQAP